MNKVYLTYDDVLLLPNYSEVSPSTTDTGTRLTKKIHLKIPLVASPMDTVCEKDMAYWLGKLGGYGIIHRNMTVSKQIEQLKWVLGKEIKAAAAVGVGPDFQGRVEALVKSGAEEICVDASHGHTRQVIAAVQLIKVQYPQVEIICGNTATYEGTKALFTAGAAAVRVGMGPGSICTTRIMSGMGVPQLSAVMDCVRAKKLFKNKFIIADGGIRTSGDIVKALAAGADSVMLGSLLAGADEAPGRKIRINRKWYKTYRGMGSIAAMKHGSAERYGQRKTAEKFVPEGVEGLVEYKEKLSELVYQLIGGLRAGMAYLGAKNLKELKQKAKFIRISPAGMSESRPHSILPLDKFF